jgi:hypothetical protein
VYFLKKHVYNRFNIVREKRMMIETAGDSAPAQVFLNGRSVRKTDLIFFGYLENKVDK